MTVEVVERLERLTADLSRLDQGFDRLATKLETAAADLRSSAAPPPEDIIADISSTRSEFNSLREAILKVAELHAVEDVEGVTKTASLTALREVVTRITEEIKNRVELTGLRERALKVLNRVILIRHKSEMPFEPLEECREKARELAAAVAALEWPEVHPEAPSLAEGTHPLAAFLSMVDNDGQLTDEQWLRAQEAVSNSLGTALAVAASRGRLYIAEENYEPGLADTRPAVVEGAVQGEVAPSPALERNDDTQGSEPRPDYDAVVLPATEPAAKKVKRPKKGKTKTPEHQLTQTSSALGAAASSTAEQASPTSETDDSGLGVDEPPFEVTEVMEVPSRSPERCFAEGEPTAAMCEKILAMTEEEASASAQELIWRLIAEGRMSAAYHLARCMESGPVQVGPTIPSWLLRAVTLGGLIRYPSGDLALILKKDLGQFDESIFQKGSPDWNHSVRFLIVAATVRASLLAPSTGAPHVLNSLWLKDGLRQLYELSDRIASFGALQQPLDSTAFKRVGDLASWQGELRNVQSETEEWCRRASLHCIHYVPAAKVWRKWLEPGGLIGSLTQTILQDNPRDLDRVRAEIERLSDPDSIRSEVRRTDRATRSSDEITARPLSQIRGYVKDILALARRWVHLQEVKPGNTRDYLQEQTAVLRRELSSRKAAVLEELALFQEHNPSPTIAAAVACCRRAIEGLMMLFDSDTQWPDDEEDMRLVLNWELLKLPDASMNEEWEPEGPTNWRLASRLIDARRAEVSWAEAIELRSAARDHEATGRIIEYVQAQGAPVDELVQLREKRLREAKEALLADLERTRQDIEKAVALGLLSETDRASHLTKVTSAELALGQTTRFFDKHAQLRRIREAIDGRKTTEIDGVRQRICEVGIEPGHEAHKRISHVLEQGDVLTANEYIDMVDRGLPLPPSEGEGGGMSGFQSFFPGTYRKIDEFMDPLPSENRPRPDTTRIVADIQRYSRAGLRTYSIGPVDMFRVAGPQITSASDMLEAWFTAKKARKIFEDPMKRVMQALGFSSSRVTVTNAGAGRSWVDVETEPLRDRTRCPVPAYGSQANGRYRVLCLWDRPTEEDIVSAVGDTSHGAPVIVFYFGLMKVERRRGLAKLCRDRRRSFIVVDDTIMIYLCGERGSRLPVLFESTLPFTSLDLYTSTAGVVWPEMFYGRERERQSIISMDGSCFIYGGRQLGKTALLRDVERSFHDPSEGKVAIWLDLKGEGIGYNRAIDEIWYLVAKELKRFDVIPSSTPARADSDRIIEDIQNWIDGDSRRRILLLLDEADRFLEHDGNSAFMLTTRLKSIMDKTSRRFKVVFAGLHNVQRTTRQENHPLAHYGEPICIGPLLENGEWREARRLIERPLSSLGYVFASPDLVTRILSQTNYYPSLIQIYCKHLLRRLTNSHGATFDPKSTPPYQITLQHVEETYLNEDLRKEIRDRFMWTLDLDPRYRVIAFAIALYSVPGNGDNGASDGFTVSWVRNQALTWWPEGFHEVGAEDTFRILLEEMVGLGVLRTLDDGRFALRSPNVISLMGTQGEIEDELERKRELPAPYEPAAFHAPMSGNGPADSLERRSPLTIQQEGELKGRKNGVSIIFGCQAAGLDDLSGALTIAFGEEFTIRLDSSLDWVEFDRQLDKLVSRPKDGTTLFLVTQASPWSEKWVQAAVKKVAKFKSKNAFVRVAFVADPSLGWQLSAAEGQQLEQLRGLGVTTFTLAPWRESAVRQWLEHIDVALILDEQRRRVYDITGGWPLLLYEFRRTCRENTRRWERQLENLALSLSEEQTAEKLLKSWGLGPGPQRTVLADLVTLGSATPQELAAVGDAGISLSLVDQALNWAGEFGVAAQVRQGVWQTDPIVSCLLNTVRR